MVWGIRTGGTTELEFERSGEVIVYDILQNDEGFSESPPIKAPT